MLFLSSLVPGECGIVENIDVKSPIRNRLFDLGIVPGTKILCVMKSPLGDPIVYFVRGTLIALRISDSSRISVNKPVTM
ncbi:MAG: FeoA domain-containing protein [Clostridia bacterium]|nr:FeoA domain-containing protein [Clostridia bacterium]